MREMTPWIGLLLVALSGCAELDQSLRILGIPPSTVLTQDKVSAGLKEALRVGTANATALTGKPDGYFRNAAIKIPMPDQLQAFEKGLRVVGLGPQVDEFVLSMNRAAERAAPQAKDIFLGAIAGMTFADAQQILSGGETAATDYFRSKTTTQLAAAFRPQVERAMNEVGVTRQYKDLVRKFKALPFANAELIDLDQYVVGKSLDGLFLMLGREERAIRQDPAARVTNLLKEVFGPTTRQRAGRSPDHPQTRPPAPLTLRAAFPLQAA